MEKAGKHVSECCTYLTHSNLLDQAHHLSKGKVGNFRINQSFHKLLAPHPRCNMDIRNVAPPSERGRCLLILAEPRADVLKF